MSIYPEPIARADLQAIRCQRELAGPKPPTNPLARLIQSSVVDRSTEPPDSVRIAQAMAAMRRLRPLRVLAVVAQNHQALRAIDGKLAELRKVGQGT